MTAARRLPTGSLAACLALASLASAAAHAAPPAASPGAAPAAPPATPSAPSSPTPAAPAAALAKKDRFARTKSTRHGSPPAPGARPAKLVNLYNFWTKEWLAVDAAAPPPHDTVDHFLRDHFTNQPTQMEPRLVEIVLAAATSFRSDVVDVVSGFRHPKYNLILRKKGHQVARDSQHTHGNAIDFYLPNVAAHALEAWARAQKIGGVGLYPESGFVHMDTGPVRYWSGE
ncbi:MAG TPA: DUF882 domain-containing protein [Kofleriaceae bacterium]|nr:DUF882 domain-containing protein [Kofleriaceae bacterium]